MARTRVEWNAEIDAYAAVVGLSSSAVADWKVLRDLCVSIAMGVEGVLDLFKTDVDYELSTKQFGTLLWYVAISKLFQSGDSLVVDNGIVKYDPVDVTHYIVTQASAKETEDGVLVLKVAKTVGTSLAALDSGELDDFKNYIKARRAPGVRMNITSGAPNVVKYSAQVLFDPLHDNDEVLAGLNAALLAFRDGFRFDAVLYVSELVAVLSDVPGVVSVDLGVSWLNPDTVTYEPVGVSVELPSGYFNWSNASVLNLSAV